LFEPLPPLTATGPPITVAPAKKLTVPVGGFPKLAVEMVAVSVTLDPAFTDVELGTTLIEVAAFVIVSDVAAELLALKLASPL
jgi:hypothetical protein